MEIARSIFYVQNFRREFGAKAVINAAYTQNLCPTRALDSITLEEVWSRKMPYNAHMCMFGCVV
jgi:hypothetical protein